jgi:hypothetical protein
MAKVLRAPTAAGGSGQKLSAAQQFRQLFEVHETPWLSGNARLTAGAHCQATEIENWPNEVRPSRCTQRKHRQDAFIWTVERL